MQISFDTSSMDDYRKFLRLKSCPSYTWKGRTAVVPDMYANHFGHQAMMVSDSYELSEFLFDYQRDIARRAIDMKSFAVFADCGLGKTLILLEFARHAAQRGKTLIVCPLMVVSQTTAEAMRFYPDTPLQQVRAAELEEWLSDTSDGIGITNYEAIRDNLPAGHLNALILDESSMLKSHYGKWGTRLLELAAGCEYRLALTGTPAPNDRIEYANHAVLCGRFRTTNEFLARYFINRGQTQNRWELKPHALQPFYKDLSDWCVFLTDPSVYGWKDNCDTIPPINIHIEQVPLTDEQRKAVQSETGNLMVSSIGGIGQRSTLARIAKGSWRGESIQTNKTSHIQNMVASWPDESTIIWCRYNDEQQLMETVFPDAASIDGSTPLDRRIELIDDFKAGRKQILISKPKILGFGLNLQIATRQVFSGLQDSYEEFYQAVKRSNRIGSTKPLNVHIPVTEIEEPMVANVLEKAARVQQDAEEQELLFRRIRNESV
jgi:superfamily II DNA or RNA helicase